MVESLLRCRGAAEWSAEGAAWAPGDHGHSKLKVLKKIDSRGVRGIDTQEALE